MLSRNIFAQARTTIGRSSMSSTMVMSRGLRTSASLMNANTGANTNAGKSLADIKSASDLLPPGAAPGSVPTDLEQSTGLERLEILGKMAGVDIFDMEPIRFSKLGTVKEPIMVDSLDTFRYVGCTGEHESHETLWVTVEEGKLSRCPECGSVFKLNFIGDHNAHDDHHH